MSRVFLSYAREDVETARKLAAVLSDAGQTVWWDRHVHGGANFSNEIERELKDADAVMVLWSPASLASAWVQDEAAEGRDSGRLVPTLLDSVKPPLGFRQLQCIDLSPWDRQGRTDPIDDLLAAISKIAGDQAPRKASQRSVEAAPISICVLPFVNLSDDSEQEYFSDGITEDIITDLSKISALEVVARNTAFTFKGKTVDVKEVARTMDVSHVVEGSVRKSGSRLRISAQLIAGDTGRQLWGERYDRDLTDIFEIQDEISHAIVEALQLKLLPEEKSAIEQRGTSNAEAYRFYLMARQQWIGGTFGDLKRDEAIARICQQAVQLDPNYAEAWALMAIAQAELRFWHGKEVNALPAAERALELRPDLPEALCVKARYVEENSQEEANALIDAALRGNPDSWEVNREAARMTFREGRIAEAIPYFEKASALVSSDYYNPVMLITCYQAIGDIEAKKRAARLVLERAERALATEPTNGSAIANGAMALAVLGEEERAREWIERGLLLDPENLAMRYNMACVLTIALHDDEAALDVIQHYFETVNTASQIKHTEADPDFNRIRETPRFQQMLAATKKRLAID